MNDILIYGATGYTGRLIADRAVAAGLRPLLAGRNAAAARTLASRLGLEHRAFGLDDAAALRKGLQGVNVVLHIHGAEHVTGREAVQLASADGSHERGLQDR